MYEYVFFCMSLFCVSKDKTEIFLFSCGCAKSCNKPRVHTHAYMHTRMCEGETELRNNTCMSINAPRVFWHIHMCNKAT